MREILYSKSHEFIYEKDGFYYTGASDILLNKLRGAVVSMELPEIGGYYTKGEIFGYLESENCASELYMPVTGRIEEINNKMPSLKNAENQTGIEDNWLIKIAADFYEQDKIDLMDYNKYKEENN